LRSNPCVTPVTMKKNVLQKAFIWYIISSLFLTHGRIYDVVSAATVNDVPVEQSSTPAPTPYPDFFSLDWADQLEGSTPGSVSQADQLFPITPTPARDEYQTQVLPSPTSPPVVYIPTSETSATIRNPVVVNKLPKDLYEPWEPLILAIDNATTSQYGIALADPFGISIIVTSQRVINEGKATHTIYPPVSLQPGKYTLAVSDWTGQVVTQVFRWGTININTDSSVYASGDLALIELTTLDDQGQRVCNAMVNLTVTDPSGYNTSLTTTDGSLSNNPDCSREANNETKPDYSGTYLVNRPGNYSMTVFAQFNDQNYILVSSIQAIDSLPLYIKRSEGQSRFNPRNTFDAVITLKANQDFQGTVVESVPENFEVSPAAEEQSYETITRDIVSYPGTPNAYGSLSLRYPFEQTYETTLRFGDPLIDPALQKLYKAFGLSGHDGIDFALPEGTPVLAADDGEVVLAGRGAYGLTVAIQHSWGKSYYGHLSGTGLSIGQKVYKGYKLGLSGQTGLTTGPHLHFGIKLNNHDPDNGYYGKTDPQSYLNGTYLIPNHTVQSIMWSVNIKKGQSINLRYRFIPPDQEPRIHLAGPLRVYTDLLSADVLGSISTASASLSSQTKLRPESMVFEERSQWLTVVDRRKIPEPAPSPNDSTKNLSEPIQRSGGSVITKIKPVNTNLVENPRAKDISKRLNLDDQKSASTSALTEEVYRWSVELPSGTTFNFGLQEPDGIRPKVKARHIDGWFISFIPSGLPSTYTVTPTVNGNTIQWPIGDGIVARYTILKDRIKADYIVNDKSEPTNNKLDFIVQYNDEYSGENGEGLKYGKGYLTPIITPEGDIDWLGENSQTYFTNPIPIIKDKNNNVYKGRYEITKIGKGTSILSIPIPKEALETNGPITIDPITIDATATTTATAYGNGRKIIRDPYGNLIALCDCGTGDDNVYYRNYNSQSWVDAAVNLDGGAGSSLHIAADLDAVANNESLHTSFINSTDSDLSYVKVAITRGGDNTISSMTAGSVFDIDTSDKTNRPSLIIANKGEGGGKEKVAVAWEMHSTSGGTKRSEIRFLQCDVADGCDAAAEWKNASEGANGSGTCVDNGTGNAGLPSAVGCTGASDSVFRTETAHDIKNHAVLLQIPGRPARTPGFVKWDDNGSFSNLTGAIDDNTTTSSEIGGLNSTQDYLYIGDLVKFSRIVVDMDADAGDINTSGNFASGTVQYCSTNSDEETTCDTWSSLRDAADRFLDNTDPSSIAFNEDGSILFNLPSDWVLSKENSDKAYWVRLRPSANFDSQVQIDEFEITDRHSKDLLMIGGNMGTEDLMADYAIWDFVGQAGWENRVANGANTNGWFPGDFGTNSALDNSGANWDTFVNFPLSVSVDPLNNALYTIYMKDVINAKLMVKKSFNYQDQGVSASWTDTSFPSITTASDTVLNMSSDQSDIYVIYVLNPGTNSLVYRKCTPSGGGDGNVCDNPSDWGSEKSLDNFVTADEIQSHPQAVVSKAYGDTTALDVIYTDINDVDVQYERQFVDMADKTIVVAASGDDAEHEDCTTGTDTQTIATERARFGREADGCGAGDHSDHHAGIRFPGVSVAPASVISSAYIDFRVYNRAGSAEIDFTVYGEDTDDSALYTLVSDCSGNSNCVNNRTKTTSSSVQAINFSGGTVEGNSNRIEVTDMIQEIVCRGAANAQPCVGNYNGTGSWASGNDISILLVSQEPGSTSNYIDITNLDDPLTTMLDPTLQINCVGPCSGTTAGRNYSIGVLKPPTANGTTGDLDHPVANVDFAAINLDDSTYASISASIVPSASSSASPTFLFKVNNANNTNTDNLSATAIVRSTIPTKNYGGPHDAGSPIYLQVYRGGGTNAWVTQATNNTSVPETDLTLDSGTISTNQSEYYFAEPGPNLACSSSSANCWSYWRVYQDAAVYANQVLLVDYFAVTYTAGGPTLDQLLRHGNWWNSSGIEQSFTF